MRIIDADALIRAIKDDTDLLAHEKIYCIKNAREAPTLDYKDLIHQGEWVMRGGKLYCTHCGKKAGVARDSEDFWYTKGTDFCPNCGARMK